MSMKRHTIKASKDQAYFRNQGCTLALALDGLVTVLDLFVLLDIVWTSQKGEQAS